MQIEGRAKLFNEWGPWTPLASDEPAHAADEIRHLLAFAGAWDKVTLSFLDKEADVPIKIQYRKAKKKKK